jgi:hypothetical protein
MLGVLDDEVIKEQLTLMTDADGSIGRVKNRQGNKQQKGENGGGRVHENGITSSKPYAPRECPHTTRRASL